MPRKPRVFSSIGIYHVVIRSVNQQIIFEENADYQKFLFILSDCKEKYDVDIYAYCLMDNHIHLLLYSSPDDLSKFFDSLGTRFVRWYNVKYKRSGHLFQDRFHSFPIEDESYYLATLCYIHNNPVAARVCIAPSEYRWSSFNAFYGAKNNIVNTSYSFEIVGAKENLLHFFATYKPLSKVENDLNEQESEPVVLRQLTDEDALHLFKKISNLTSVFQIPNIPKRERNTIVFEMLSNGVTQRQASRILGISLSTIQRIWTSYKKEKTKK